MCRSVGSVVVASVCAKVEGCVVVLAVQRWGSLRCTLGLVPRPFTSPQPCVLKGRSGGTVLRQDGVPAGVVGGEVKEVLEPRCGTAPACWGEPTPLGEAGSRLPGGRWGLQYLAAGRGGVDNPYLKREKGEGGGYGRALSFVRKLT